MPLPFLKKFLPDALLIVGAAGVTYGVWAAWPPAGYVVAGAFMIYAGLRLV